MPNLRISWHKDALKVKNFPLNSLTSSFYFTLPHLQEEVKTKLEMQQKLADEAQAEKTKLISRIRELEDKVSIERFR